MNNSPCSYNRTALKNNTRQPDGVRLSDLPTMTNSVPADCFIRWNNTKNLPFNSSLQNHF